MTPDKVYVLCDYDGRPGNVDIYPLGKRSQEYIRKDVLLEWAKGLYEKTMTFVQGDAIVDHAIQLFALNIKKHIESL